MLSLFAKKGEIIQESTVEFEKVQENIESESEHINSINKSMIYDIPVKNIAPNPNQPRKEFDERALYGLAQSIKDYGIIQPLSVRLFDNISENSLERKYELIAGERRLRAARLLFMDTVPCVIVEADNQATAQTTAVLCRNL